MAEQAKPFSLAGLKPALFRSLSEGYSAGDFRKDLVAGLTVGVVALPLAMAFAIGAGASPAQGLYTAIIGGLVIAIFGGSKFQVSGPTGAFVVIIAEVIALHGMDGLVVATILAGLILVALGVSGLGTLIKFIPYPVTVGFTTGIGVIIFVGQIKDLLGLDIPKLDPEFFGKIGQYAAAAGSISPWPAALGLGTVALIYFIRKLAPKVPSAVTAVALVTLAAWILKLPADSIGSRYGAIPTGFPLPAFPSFSLEMIREVFPSAVTIALLAAIESLLSAVVADGMTGDRHSSSAELTAQGLGNIASVFFGGIPATGAIARTATNIKAGARSPVSAIVHAFVLLAFTLFLGPVAEAIPLAALAGVLVVVAIDMSELPRFLAMRHMPRSDLLVMIATFAITVVVDLTAAVEVGMALAVLLFMKRSAETSTIRPAGSLLAPAEREAEAGDGADLTLPVSIPAGCEVYEINGPFFFGVADMLQDALSGLEKPPAVFVLRMRHVPAIDATGLNALSGFAKRCRKQGTALVLSGVREQPREAIRKIGLEELVGADNVHASVGQAFARVQELLDTAPQTARGKPRVSRRRKGDGSR
jgi:SulP family sulfate permease